MGVEDAQGFSDHGRSGAASRGSSWMPWRDSARLPVVSIVGRQRRDHAVSGDSSPRRAGQAFKTGQQLRVEVWAERCISRLMNHTVLAVLGERAYGCTAFLEVLAELVGQGEVRLGSAH